MSCEAIIERLEAHIAGALADAQRREVDDHLRGCADCSALRAILAGDAGGPPLELVRGVLARTSGSTCGSAREQLCDHVDGRLGDVDGTLLRSHLDGCEDCGALARSLALLSVELPRLAELPLDDTFVAGVLRRTTARRAPAASWSERIAEVWERLVQRPRLAWEVAYVASMLLLLIFGAPGSPLAGVPAKVAELTRINPVHELKQPAAQLTSEIEQTWAKLGVENAWKSSGEWVAGKSKEGVNGVAVLSESTLGKLKQLGTLWAGDASESAQNDTDDTTSADNE